MRLLRAMMSRDCPVTNERAWSVQLDQPDTRQFLGSTHSPKSLGLSMWAQYLKAQKTKSHQILKVLATKEKESHISEIDSNFLVYERCREWRRFNCEEQTSLQSAHFDIHFHFLRCAGFYKFELCGDCVLLNEEGGSTCFKMGGGRILVLESDHNPLRPNHIRCVSAFSRIFPSPRSLKKPSRKNAMGQVA